MSIRQFDVKLDIKEITERVEDKIPIQPVVPQGIKEFKENQKVKKSTKRSKEQGFRFVCGGENEKAKFKSKLEELGKWHGERREA